MTADLANRALGLIKMAILARLLAPGDFGLMGLAVLVLGWFDMFSQTGFATALIRKPGDVRSYLGTFWTVQLIRGAFLCAVLFAGAPVCGAFFHNPGVVPLIRAISVVALLKGAANPAIIYLRRQLKMDREVVWRVGGNLAGLIVAVPFAFQYRNVWALVAAALAANVAELILSYWVVPHRPELRLDWGKAREMMRFGKWIFWANAASYVSLYCDGWVVGRFLGGISLGYYQVAQQFGMAPLASIGGHITAVGLPAFSKLQDAPSRRSAYLRSVRFTSIVLFPLGALGTVFADLAVRLILGDKWIPTSPLLRLLIWAGIFTALSGVSTALLQAVDRPNISARAAILKFGIFGLVAFPLISAYGLNGVALAAMISSPISFSYLHGRAADVLGWGWDMVEVFRPSVIACLPAVSVVIAACFLPAIDGNILTAAFASMCCVGLSVWDLWAVWRLT